MLKILSKKDIIMNSKDSEINRFYRGSNYGQIIKGNARYLLSILPSRGRRKLLRYKRTLKHEQLRQNMIYSLIKKAYGTKYSKTSGNKLKTHSRNCLILPGFVKKNISVYNGHIFNNIDIKVSMIGRYLGEYSLTYKPVKHGNPGIGASHSSRFIPLR